MRKSTKASEQGFTLGDTNLSTFTISGAVNANGLLNTAPVIKEASSEE